MSTPGAYQEQVKKKRARLCPAPHAGGSVTHIMPTGDIRKVKDQNFLVLSYATPDGTTRVTSPRGMVFKFSGAFATEKEAGAHAELIRNEDPRFDIYVVDMYQWGMVPLPEDEKPFVTRKYADSMLTRIVSGLQNSMEQGKKEMEERKERDRKKAEQAMRIATKNPNYKMPEKSDVLLKYEEKIKKEREADETKKMHSEQDLANIAMNYFVERVGRVIDAGTGADFMKFFVERSIQQDVLVMQAKDSEKPDSNPADIEKQLAESKAKDRAESEK